jgi:hypothetical protein
LRDKEKARRMGENGLALVSEQYDFNRYVAGLETMFAKISRKRVRKPREPRTSYAAPAPVPASLTMAGGLERACSLHQFGRSTG